jgi:hypothetical protein
VYVLLAASLPLLKPQPQFTGVLLIAPTVTIVLSVILLALVFAGTAIRGSAYLHHRRDEMTAAATRLGLHAWSGEALPRGLSLEGTHFHKPYKLSNIHQGIINHNEVIFLDIEKQEKRARWCRTIVAIRTREHLHTPPSMESRQVGSWRLIYCPVGYADSAELMEAGELESLLRSIIH